MRIKRKEELTKRNILWLAQKNIRMKRARVRFTILAMVVGVGFLTLLISIGYGLQRLVINQIASFQSLKTADVTSSNFKIKEEKILEFKKIAGVSKIEPLITLVGKGEFRGSSFDVGILGATTNYLLLSDIKPLYGNFYNSNNISLEENHNSNSESAFQKNQKIIEEILFNIKEGRWAKVREKPSLDSKIIGYTTRHKKEIRGEVVIGQEYLAISSVARANIVGSYTDEWLKAKVLLWQIKPDGSVEPVIENNKQKEVVGYFGKNEIDPSSLRSEVRAEVVDKDKENNSQQINSQNFLKLAVVNEAVVKMMGIEKPNDVLGKEIDIIANVPGSEEGSIKKVRVEKIKIVGIVGGAESPQIYLPLITLKSLGVQEFSQVKIQVDKKENLAKARKQIEIMGFQTASVADTVDRVSQVFKWINIGFFIVGSIALIIATLGMFNTLTVSLLERTREIGIMKAIGMKRKEVMLLFFFEAGLMGFWGGLIGIASGYLTAQIINVAVNFLLIPPARRFTSIISLPWYFPFAMIIFTILIALLTAIIPARRAARISPLNAIRYE